MTGIYPHQTKCPAEGKTCRKCEKKGHYARCCKSKTEVQGKKVPFRGRTPNFHENKHRKPLNQIAHSPHSLNVYDSYEQSDSDESLFAIRTLYDCPVSQKEQVYLQSAKTDFQTTVRIENQKVRVLIDSGASVNVLNERTFTALNKRLNNALNLEKTKTKIFSYGNTNDELLKILGKTVVLLETKNKFLMSTFYVVETEHQNLLAGETAISLGILNLNKQETINTCQQQTNVHGGVSSRLVPLINKFQNTIFSGRIGKLKNYQVKLHIDKNIPPVAQKERRIPFALRKKVENEIKRLEEEDIIEDVTAQPTPWLNALVIVPKGEDQIRLCVDMRAANNAITITRYPTPTVDDLMIKLKGAKVFTKLDLTSAFYQLELTPESRMITAFQTDTRIKRFKRLIFGANSASEELQHALRSIIADIENVINIADDLLIFGADDNEHDMTLKKVLHRFEEKGLTLNLRKCVFSQNELKFYGYIFSGDGMKPNPSKVEEIRNTPVPKDAKELKSFLGLTNYMKRFISDYSTITYPLRKLLKKDSEWIWENTCEKSFNILKTI